MNESQSETKPVKTWQKTKHANLVRNSSSGNYYARFRVKGKLLWRCLNTDRISVAQIRLADELKKERQKAGNGMAVSRGRMAVGDVMAVYRQRLQGSPQLKIKTKSYHEQRLAAILKSWPGLEKLDMARVTKTDCLNWAAKFGQNCASSTFNHSLGILKQVFEIGVETGARYDNPAQTLKRVAVRSQKLRLPEPEQFDKFVKEIETSGSGFSKHCADLVRFLAYGGFRITESKYITWADCDFDKGTITVRGEPGSGTKGTGDPRTAPMIPEMKQLLKRLQAQRPGESADTPVMRVHECQRAMNRAARIVKMERMTHHDLRHLFATRCIESGVDIPTVSRWLGHKDGGALAMRVYGHLRDYHSTEMAQKVTFSKPEKIVKIP